MPIHFKAVETTCEKVKPSEAFSTAGPEYWEHVDAQSIGERVYIRTDAPCPPGDEGRPIYVITVEQGDTR